MAKKANQSLIDPIYQKFVRGITRAIGSTEFYEFFMDSISRAQNEIQFSNRRLIKTVDLTWVDAIEESLNAMQEIISSPRTVIKEEELIVNVANVKKSGAETVRHLAMHSALVEDFKEETGDVRPSRMMQRYREDTFGLYENRLVFTTMENAYHFVKIRHDALFSAMNDEYGAKLKLKSDMDSATEHVHMDMFLHIKNIDGALETDDKNAEVFGRISRIYRVLSVYMNSQFAQQMSKLARIKGTINKTNVLKKNPKYKAILKLFEFLRQYDDIGYTIRVVEQSPEVNDRFQEDIYRNILFNYLILKGYLEDEDSRIIPVAPREKKKVLKPKFIRQIVEELTEDYDLPDVEIRKVLIEELTKEQLMQEEAEERRRLVEEQEKRKKEEEERIKAAKKAEEERIKAEKAAEQERIRQEKEAEAMRLRQERMERELEDRRRGGLFKKELSYFSEHMAERVELRRAAEEEALKQKEKEDYMDAVRLLEESEERKREELARAKKRKQDEKERARREKAEAEERARQEKLAEEARIAAEREAEAARLAEEERVRLEQEAREYLKAYLPELEAFPARLEERMALRQKQEEERQAEMAAREQARKDRLAKRMAQ